MIWDAHAHIASLRCIPESFVLGAARNMAAAVASQTATAPNERFLANLFMSKMQDEECDELVSEMDEAGIEKTVLLAADFTYALRDSSCSIEEIFDIHRKVLEKHRERFEVFGGIDPRWGRDGIDLFERAVTELGFKGLKVYPPCGFSASDRSMDPFYEICAARNLPVLIHVGPTSPALPFEPARAWNTDDCAFRFPNVNFILAHAATAHTDSCIMLARYRPNVFLDVSGYQTLLRKGNSCPGLIELLESDIAHKILFGTDWPVFRLQGSQSQFCRSFLEDEPRVTALTDRTRDSVMAGTIRMLLGDTNADGAAEAASSA